MEQLPDHEQELAHRHNKAIGLEVQFVWNSLLSLAYSKVHDHVANETFNSVAPEGIHPKETFDHPFIYRVGEPSGLLIEPTPEEIEEYGTGS